MFGCKLTFRKIKYLFEFKLKESVLVHAGERWFTESKDDYNLINE